jgi:acyl-coenzyme A synthetase/AMP-(fatty) acid ligase
MIINAWSILTSAPKGVCTSLETVHDAMKTVTTGLLRVDDVLNVSAIVSVLPSVESAFSSHDSVAEAGGRVPARHQGPHLRYVMPMRGVTPSEDLIKELKAFVVEQVDRPPPILFSGHPAYRKPVQDHALYFCADRLR